MEEKFNEIFLNFVKGKRHLIPPKSKYDEIMATLQKLATEKSKSMSEKETIFFETILYVSNKKSNSLPS